MLCINVNAQEAVLLRLNCEKGVIYDISMKSSQEMGTVMSMGMTLDMSVKILEVKDYLLQELKNIKELFVYGEPKLSVVAVGSEDFDINLLSSKLKDKKWNLNMIQNPKGFHICLTNCHSKEVIDQLINDIKETIKDIDMNYKGEKSTCIYGTAQEISDKEIIREVVSEYLYTLNKID